MRIGVNVPNFGPGTDPGMLRDWARTVEGLGFDALMVSDHVAITPDVAEQYPAPFYEPFTTLSWLAGVTTRIRLGTTVLIVPYRHPLLTARMAADLDRISGGRLILGVGIGWARQEFEALGVPYERRGALTDEYLHAIRTAWEDTAGYGTGRIPIWVGGHSDAGLDRAVRLGDAWHPLRTTIDWLGDRDISAHPELKLAVWAARELDAETAAVTTMYTSCQPLRHVRGRHRTLRPGPRRVRAVQRAARRAQAGRRLAPRPRRRPRPAR
jgi:hypothetical protein